MKTTVIYHSADFDGIFCREIARKFLGDKDVQYIGWNFGDPPIDFPPTGLVYVMDLPLDKPFGYTSYPLEMAPAIVWIDHHASIASHPTDIQGYRIDGVAACRLAWQWFVHDHTDLVVQFNGLPDKRDFIDRKVSEPLAVRLAGEYDVWDKRDPQADLLQYGLRSDHIDDNDWSDLLNMGTNELLHVQESQVAVSFLCERGGAARWYAQTVDASNMKGSFLTKWEGLTFLCLNGRGNSLTFASLDVPETGHDALLMFYLNAHREWVVSLHHAKHRTDLDLSAIAVRHGGGGHKGACGFTWKQWPLPFQV